MANSLFSSPRHLGALRLGLIGLGAMTILGACQPQASDPVGAPDEGMTSTDPATTSTDPAALGAPGTIVDVAAQDESFSTLVQAIEAAGLAETLSADGPYTVFAPTNEAFEALPEGTLEQLLEPENQATLAQILTYHVLPSEVPAADVTAGNVDTVAGEPLTLTLDDATNGVIVNDATVVQPDIEASNGVIHAIDQVLLPPGAAL